MMMEVYRVLGEIQGMGNQESYPRKVTFKLRPERQVRAKQR